MKIQGPEGCTSASVGGVIYEIGEDGLFDVPGDKQFQELRGHGFTMPVEKAEKPAKKAAGPKAE